ncbi:MAG: hypothetical protein DRP60_02310 [Spirochaetes bacterium]|nr:MAG: hypothetical protein DRP60_02310 [Spirochaetota bacterium]
MKNRISTGIKFSLLSAMALFLFVSCGALSSLNNVTDGYGGVALNVQGTAPSVSLSARASGNFISVPVTDVSGAETGTITLREARLVLSEIEFEQDDMEIDTDLEEEQDIESELELEGPFIVDLLNGTVEPNLPYTELLPGTYTEINLKLNKIEMDDWEAGDTALVEMTDPLYGNSIYLAGTYTGYLSDFNAVDLEFSFSFNLDEEFETAAGDFNEGIVIDEGVINPILIAFRLSKWFQFDNAERNPDEVDFTTIYPLSDGDGGHRIVFNEQSINDYAAISDVIKKNIKESADYGEDEDLSGFLESDEDDDPGSEDDDDY